jgi:hypothetical protein
MPSFCRRLQTVAMEAGKGVANESSVRNKTIAHRDFAAICCYLQVLRPLGREASGTDDRTARTRCQAGGRRFAGDCGFLHLRWAGWRTPARQGAVAPRRKPGSWVIPDFAVVEMGLGTGGWFVTRNAGSAEARAGLRLSRVVPGLCICHGREVSGPEFRCGISTRVWPADGSAHRGQPWGGASRDASRPWTGWTEWEKRPVYGSNIGMPPGRAVGLIVWVRGAT